MADQPQRIRLDEIDDLGSGCILGETSQEIELTSSEEHTILTDHLASRAGRTIRIFTRNLDPVIYDRTEFIAACKQLALRSRFARIEILAFESQSIIRRGHRMINLARALSSRIEIRRPEKEFEKHLHAFITFDEIGYIYRTYADRFEGYGNCHAARETREFEKLFKEMWLRSHTDSELRSLNI